MAFVEESVPMAAKPTLSQRVADLVEELRNAQAIISELEDDKDAHHTRLIRLEKEVGLM